jgi:hypothetical protein
MLNYFSQKNLLSSSLLGLSLFMLSPEGKSMDENDTFFIQKRAAAIPLTFTKGTAVEYKYDAKNGIIMITTDNNANATYQATTQRIKVISDDIFKIRFDIKVEEGGKMSFGVLNTKRNGWIEGEVVLDPGMHNSSKKIVIPPEESEISVVFRNYHLTSNGGAGQSKFMAKLTLERIEEEKELSLSILKSSNPPVQPMPPKEKEITIGGYTPNKIAHNFVTETNKGVNKVVTETNKGVNKVKRLFKKNKNKK